MVAREWIASKGQRVRIFMQIPPAPTTHIPPTIHPTTPHPHTRHMLLLNPPNEPPHQIGPHLIREYDPTLLQSTLDLLTPERMVVMAVAKAYEGTTTLTEPWYVGTCLLVSLLHVCARSQSHAADAQQYQRQPPHTNQTQTSRTHHHPPKKVWHSV